MGKPYVVDAFAFRFDGGPMAKPYWEITVPRRGGGRFMSMYLRINRAVQRALGDARMGYVRVTVEWLEEIQESTEGEG